MDKFNTTDVLLSDTIRSILQVFEAPPPVIDHFRLDDVKGDPFGWAQSFYKFRRIEHGLELKLQVLLVLTGLIFLQSITTLIYQYRAPSQASVRWFFRKQYHSQSKNPYIVPHPVNVIVLASLVTSVLLTIYLGFTYHAWAVGKPARLIHITSWFPSVWFIYYAAVWFSGFGSLYLTYLVPTQYTRRGSLTGARRHASPLLVNALCFGVPILCIVTNLPLQVKQSWEMRATMKSAKALYNILGPFSLAWKTSPDAINTVSFNVVQDAAQKALSAKHTWEDFWTAELALWSFWSLLALVIAVPFCLSLVLSTHRRIRRMAIAQSGLNQWTTGQFHKQSPPTEHSSQSSPVEPTKEALSPWSSKSISFAPSTPSSFNLPVYASPTSSFPPSAVQTPNTYEHMHQPFFGFHSPGSFSSKSPSILDQSSTNGASPMPHLYKDGGKRASSYGRHSIHVLRRISTSAVFPSRAGGGDAKGRAHLEGLDKRYWHIVAEYTTVLLVMVLLCAFAMFELASQSKLLFDCPRKVLTTMVVSFAYCCLVNLWLCYNLYRLYRDSKTLARSRSDSSVSASSSSQGKRYSTGDLFQDYTIPQKRQSKSLVHFSDMIRNGSQYEPERRPSSPDPNSTSDSSTGHGNKREFGGLQIEIITDLDKPIGQRPTVTGQTLHQSFERRRSSYRAPSMDLTEALALAPITLHRRCSTHS